MREALVADLVVAPVLSAATLELLGVVGFALRALKEPE
jgi:hypothetical protein